MQAAPASFQIPNDSLNEAKEEEVRSLSGEALLSRLAAIAILWQEAVANFRPLLPRFPRIETEVCQIGEIRL